MADRGGGTDGPGGPGGPDVVTTKFDVEEFLPSDTTTADPVVPGGIVNENVETPLNEVTGLAGLVTAVTPPTVTVNGALAKKPEAVTETEVLTCPLALLSGPRLGVTVNEVGELRGAAGGSDTDTGHAPLPMFTTSLVADA
jgi:hypothetical protein